MLLPSPGDLLRGIRIGLAASVLPVVPKGVAERQLKAAVFILRRLERIWDLLPAHVDADNADVETVLGSVLTELVAAEGGEGYGDLQGRLSALAGAELAPPSGFNDPALRARAARNRALHQILETVELRLRRNALLDPRIAAECHSALGALYRRMAERDSLSVGD